MGVRQVAFHLTDRCQLDCKHCLRDPEKKPVDIDLDVIVQTLEQAARLYAVSHVTFTGGEPTLYPHFEAALDAAAARGFAWSMVSNGHRFAKVLARISERPARRAAFDHVMFSLDGATEEAHDRIRGAGSFREVMSACASATAHGIAFGIQLVVTALNAHQLEELGVLAAHLGAREASFVVVQPTGTHHDAQLALPPAKWRGILDRLERLAGTLRMPIRLPEGWPQKSAFHVCGPFRSETLHVDMRGRLNLCCQHAGIPASPDAPAGESDVVADLHATPLAEAHAQLLGVIHRAEAAKLAQAARGEVGEWDRFPCNWCLKHFGKPHWTDAGPSGPDAERPRWTGARGAAKGQAPRPRLPVVRG